MLSAAEASALLARTEDDLWELVGDGLNSAFGATPMPKRHLIEAAKKWFDDNYQSLQGKICPHPIVARLLSDETSDDVSIVVGIASIISDSLTGIVAAGVSVLIVRRGCRMFCADYEE